MSRLKTRLSLSCLAAGLLLALAGCSSPEPTAGSVQLSLSLPSSLASGDVTHVAVTLSAPDLPPRILNLARVDGRWIGTFGDIPPGTERTFAAQAFGTSGVPRFQGQVSGITITAGQNAAVAFALQEVGTPPPLDNSVPEVRALVASQSLVQPGGSLSLEVRAVDPDADSLSYAWTATAGSFSTPSRSSTSWTAPQSPGTATLTVTVTDSRGAKASLALPVDVGTFPPVVAAKELRPLSSPDGFSLYVAGWDPHGTDLAFSWSTNWGSLAAPVSNRSSSESTWTVPGNCIPEGTVPLVTVSLRNTLGQATVTTFSLPPSFPACGTWAPSPPSMSTARRDHTATLLPSGQVLVTGGNGVDSAHFAELYDPASNSWRAVASPDCDGASTCLLLHTATLLPSGKVLIAGGEGVSRYSGAPSPFGWATLYDPAGSPEAPTGSWSHAGYMASPRVSHTATLLPSGKVLIAGGSDGVDFLSSAELYDPATNSWSPAGAMAAPRIGHTATLLPNGQVLVAGSYVGASSPTATASAELYDPVSNSWSPASPMFFARHDHTATLLSSGKVLIAGGAGDAGSLATAELYDPATGTWTLTGAMAAGRAIHSATLLASGLVLVAGGGGSGGVLATAELYDPATSTFRARPSMNEGRSEGVATRLPSGQVLITGGMWFETPEKGGSSTYGGPLSSTELYFP